MVYEPREDSQLLLNTVLKHLTSFLKIKNLKILDLGTGSGFIAVNLCLELIKKGKQDFSITASDIDVKALKSLKNKLKKHEELQRKIKILKSDLFKNIKTRFDLILFNAPYLPRGVPSFEQTSDYETIGGKHGYETILRFLTKVSDFLTSNGSCFLVYSSLSKPHIIKEYAKKQLLKLNVANQKKLFFETIFVAKIEKTRLLQELQDHGFKSVQYLTQGKHSFVYKAVLGKQQVIVKVAKPGFERNVKKECSLLKRLSRHGFVPMVYDCKNNWVAMQFIKGLTIHELLSQALQPGKTDQILLRKKILKVLKHCLKNCYLLDVEGLTKQEMHRPQKHIIIKNGKCFFIDFERCFEAEKPKNVTQFCQYLMSDFALQALSSIGLKIDKESLIKLCKQYKKSFGSFKEQVFNKILKTITNGSNS
ncbi:methyltransferase [Candidatus Woesearchaeota archaeon]|nr:methyltransferase [Candidatus Woesearchaeota archaeon]